MKPPTRPKNVPEQAVWAENDKVWQLGKSEKRGILRKVEVCVGEWRYWRKDGSLCCVANFDAEGNQDGIVERFHPDGTLASRGEWKNGNRFGHFVFIQSENDTDESYGAGYDTWRYEFDSTKNWEENNVHYYLKDGTECTSRGKPLAEAYDLDNTLLAADPATFLQTDAKQILAKLEPHRAEAEEIGDPLSLQELWGLTDTDVDAFLNRVAEGDEFRPATERRKFEKNIWESLIAHPWDNINEELGVAFLGAAKIGYIGDSDHAYATLFLPRKEKPLPNAVLIWDHDYYCIDEVLSLSIDEFAYRVTVSTGYEQERLSRKAARRAWKKLAGKCSVGWQISKGLKNDDDLEDSSLEEDVEDIKDIDDVEDADDSEENYRVELDSEHHIRGPFWRAQWIIQLLREDKYRDWDAVKECFRPGWNKALDTETYESLKTSGKERLYPTALYLLWRLFWFDYQDRLHECCDFYRNHPARMVRDLVVLLEEIGAGKRKIGDIEDIIAVRDQFLSLDLAPERALERQEENSKNAQVETFRVEAIVQEAKLIAEGGLDKILDQTWERITDPAAVMEFEKLARAIPGHEMQWKCFDWINNGGYIRAQIDATEEAIGVGRWLGKNDSKILQPFIWARVHFDQPSQIAPLLLPAIGDTPDALDTRLVDCCLKQLDSDEEYHFKQSLAVTLLAKMQIADAVPRLCKVFEEYFTALKGKADFEARLATIPWEDYLVATANALEKLAQNQSAINHRELAINALQKLLQFSLNEHDHKVCVATTDALVAWGDTNLLPSIEKLINVNDTRVEVSALRALEKIAPVLKTDARKLFVALSFRNPDENDNSVTLMYYRAANALCKADPSLGEQTSMKDALQESRELGTYGQDLWKMWRLMECETVGKFDELEIDSISHYLQSSDTEIREAAEQAYTARGITCLATKPIVWPEIWQVLEDSQKYSDCTNNEDGLAQFAVGRLMMEEGSVDLSAPAAWMWENPGEGAAPALGEMVERKLKVLPKVERGEYLPAEYQWLLRALVKHAKFPSCSDLVERCLKEESEDVAAALIQDIDSIPFSFANQLVTIAKEQDGWQKYAIANWLLKNMKEPEITAALQSAKLTEKTIKAWAN